MCRTVQTEQHLELQIDFGLYVLLVYKGGQFEASSENCRAAVVFSTMRPLVALALLVCLCIAIQMTMGKGHGSNKSKYMFRYNTEAGRYLHIEYSQIF
jgi:hypothetical protein